MCPIRVATSEQLEIRFRAWGGRRPHAGRKPSGRKVGVPHRARPLHEWRYPVHVTFRAERLLPSLREERFVLALRRGLARASRSGFRILQFSIQTNHLHLMVEAEDRSALSRGLQGLGIRLAKAVNRVLGRRGKVWADRFHARALTTPREVRNGLVYVLQNWRKHLPAGRSRSVLFGGMVHRLADSGPRGVRTSAGVPAAHLAGGSGMAAARTHRS